jgi:hypothetical protein
MGTMRGVRPRARPLPGNCSGRRTPWSRPDLSNDYWSCRRRRRELPVGGPHASRGRRAARPVARRWATAAIDETVWAVVRDKKLGPRAGVEDLAARLNAIAQRNNYSGTTEA